MLEPFFLRANLNASLEGATRHGAVEMGTDEISEGIERRSCLWARSGGDVVTSWRHFHHPSFPPSVNVTPLRISNGAAGNPNTD
jgi:hypothetical protein